MERVTYIFECVNGNKIRFSDLDEDNEMAVTVMVQDPMYFEDTVYMDLHSIKSLHKHLEYLINK